jgi:hypothetical protein
VEKIVTMYEEAGKKVVKNLPKVRYLFVQWLDVEGGLVKES